MLAKLTYESNRFSFNVNSSRQLDELVRESQNTHLQFFQERHIFGFKCIKLENKINDILITTFD